MKNPHGGSAPLTSLGLTLLLVSSACGGDKGDTAIWDPCAEGSGPCESLTEAHAVLADPSPGTLAGASVAMVGDVDGDAQDDFMIGAPRSAADDGENGGAVWVVMADVEGSTELSTELGARLQGSALDYAGFSLSRAGDVNADGYGDVLVATGGSEGSTYQQAKVRLLYGPFSGEILLVGTDPGVVGISGGLGKYTSCCLAPMTDLDGDDVPDLAIGNPSDKVHGDASGAVYVIPGPIDGRRELSSSSTMLSGEESNDQTGRSIAVGDFNADGLGDLLIGAPQGGAEDRGAVHLWFGPLSGDSEVIEGDAWIQDSESRASYAGLYLVSQLDFDADGYDDILLSAPRETGRGSMQGAVYLFTGSITGARSLSEADAIFHASPPGLLSADEWGTLGETLSAGDLDGDSSLDLVVSAPSSVGTAAFLVSGPYEGSIDLSTGATLLGAAEPQRATGAAVSTGSDVDGDGLDDLLVGAPSGSGSHDQGVSYLLLGAHIDLP